MKIFNSFFMGGFECADHINRFGLRVNLLRETEHDIRVEEDYSALVDLNITTVREGICWSAVEVRPFVFDFTEVLNRMKAAAKYGVQQIWDLCHFGYPDDIYPTHPNFCKRFVALCEAFANFYNNHSDSPLFVVPINEISFLSWHSGDVRGTSPFAINSGFDIKYHLCKAAILGIAALKYLAPTCKVILVEPLIKIHSDDESFFEHLHSHNEVQFQAMDIILGRLCPELGGYADHIDLLGFNYYWNSQWCHGEGPLLWPEVEEKRAKVSTLLNMAYQRYKLPIFLSETGHFGSGRVEWLNEIVAESLQAITEGTELLGVCIYPVTDRPDWDNLNSYSQCGIWDLDAQKNRTPHFPYLTAVQLAGQQLAVYQQQQVKND